MKKINLLMLMVTTFALTSCGGGDTPTPEGYCRVTFNTNGGTPSVPYQDVKIGGTVDEPKVKLVKQGYTFEYWYKTDENVKYDFSTAVSDSFTLNAKWVSGDVPQYTVTFKLNSEGDTGIEGKEGLTDKTYTIPEGKTVGETISVPRTNFKGFYVQGDTEKKIIENYDSLPVTKNITYVADYDYTGQYGGYQPLTLIANTNGSTLKVVGKLLDLEYKLNSNEWTTLTVGESGSNTLTLNKNDQIQLRNKTTKWSQATSLTSGGYAQILLGDTTGTGFDITGCMDSLINYSDTLYDYCFGSTFINGAIHIVNNYGFVDHYRNKLRYYCFAYMFESSSISEADFNLFSTTLSTGCYYEMFVDCQNLARMPSMYDGTNPIFLNNENVGYVEAMKDMFSIPGPLENTGKLHLTTTPRYQGQPADLKITATLGQQAVNTATPGMFIGQLIDNKKITTGGYATVDTEYYQ